MTSRPPGGQLVQLDKIVAWRGAVLFAIVFTVLWLSHWFRWVKAVAYPGILFRGVQQIHLRTEDRENGDLGAVAA